MSKHSILLWPYFALMIVGLVLPSDGSHGLLNPKSLFFLLTISTIGIYFLLKSNMTLYQVKLMAFTLCSCSFLFFWLMIGSLISQTPFSSSFDQFKVFLITIAFTVSTLFLIDEGLVSAQKVLRVVIFSNFAYSLCKVLIVIFHFLNLLNMWTLLDKLGVRFMSMLIVSGFTRLQTSVDIITPFLILFVLHSKNLNLALTRRFQVIYCVISILATFLSFSRFLIGVAFVSFLFYGLTLNIKRQMQGLVLFAAAGLMIAFLIGFDNISLIVEQRFFSKDNYLSDLTRVQQIEALMEEHQSSPYFGLGLGGYAKNFIRDDQLRHSYEVQWVAFLMQFGLLGILLLMIPLGIISKKFILLPFSLERWTFFGLFVIWLLSGFTNPFLISLTSGIVYTSFILAAEIFSKNAQDELCI